MTQLDFWFFFELSLSHSPSFGCGRFWTNETSFVVYLCVTAETLFTSHSSTYVPSFASNFIKKINLFSIFDVQKKPTDSEKVHLSQTRATWNDCGHLVVEAVKWKVFTLDFLCYRIMIPSPMLSIVKCYSLTLLRHSDFFPSTSIFSRKRSAQTLMKFW